MSTDEVGVIRPPCRLHSAPGALDVTDRFTWHRARDGSVTATLAEGPTPLGVVDPGDQRRVRMIERGGTLRWPAQPPTSPAHRAPDYTEDGIDTWDLGAIDVEHDPTSTVTGPVVRLDGRELTLAAAAELHQALAWVLAQHEPAGTVGGGA